MEQSFSKNGSTFRCWADGPLGEFTKSIASPRLTVTTTHDVNYLALSGGGSGGAFSAGVLNGWTDRGTRPDFDVVSGVSTGALIAPLAFLGSSYDLILKTNYTTLDNDALIQLQTP